MAFCGKCGKPVEDGAAFCASCGAPMNAAPVQQAAEQVQQEVQQQAPKAPKTPKQISTEGLIKLPSSIVDWIGLGLIVLSFIFMFLAWGIIKESYFGVTMKATANIFGGKAFGIKISSFDISACLGIANIFGIIAIVAFVVYIVTYFIDLGKFVPALASIDLNKFSKLAYFGCYALAIVFGFIGVLTGEMKLAFGFFLALVIFILAVIAEFKKDLVASLIPSNKE